jgi:hypothetical protein
VKKPEVGPTQFKIEVERLLREGKMPTLEKLLDAIKETREIYQPKILAARKGK